MWVCVHVCERVCVHVCAQGIIKDLKTGLNKEQFRKTEKI